MRAIIFSDLHIGSPYCLHQEFERVFKTIPETYEIILNGDILDVPDKNMILPHQRILNLIKQRSYRQRVVWVHGNHDEGYIPDEFGNVHVYRTYALEKKLLITHGHDFDDIMPRNQSFMRVFSRIHKLRVVLGARPVHVAKYAKKWKICYNVLRVNVMKNAVKCAQENGYQAVTCGHTHYAEDVIHCGIRYINTGAWTESPSHYLLITNGEMSLKTSIDSIEEGRDSELPNQTKHAIEST
jgi:UDP-2,3-diacylglucosamine pyrophosphatase LpxH